MEIIYASSGGLNKRESLQNYIPHLSFNFELDFRKLDYVSF
ncbi:hypothetical protein RintRC_1335 [Richelia intracellularis]|nr:hypothetical protein RintRC_1335 [Richelia intracellularis]